MEISPSFDSGYLLASEGVFSQSQLGGVCVGLQILVAEDVYAAMLHYSA